MIDPEDHLLDALYTLAVHLATEAGTLLAERRTLVRQLVETKSSRTDMVTEVDWAAETLIVEQLGAERPHDGILGEEGGERRGTSGVRWVIDPLDGTTNYLYGFPAYGVSIAAELDGQTVAGAVHDAVHGETFSAARGRGARCNGTPIAVSAADTLSTALVATGFGYDAARRALQGQVLAQVVAAMRDMRRAGAAALDLCWLACGRVDAFYEHGLEPWDIAAGELIVREAGGLTGRLAASIISTEGFWATNPLLAEAFLALLHKAGGGEERS